MKVSKVKVGTIVEFSPKDDFTKTHGHSYDRTPTDDVELDSGESQWHPRIHLEDGDRAICYYAYFGCSPNVTKWITIPSSSKQKGELFHIDTRRSDHRHFKKIS